MTTTATRRPDTLLPFLTRSMDVTINHPGYPGEYTVHQVKRTKAIVKPKGQPDSRGLDAPMNLLVPTGTRSTLPAETTAVSTGIGPGTIVRLLRPFRGYTPQTPMVVVKVNGTTLTLHRLGGEQPGERGMRIAPSGVKQIDLADLGSYLGS